MLLKKILPAFLLGLLASSPALAAEAAAIDTGDTAWMLLSTALVLIMTPGLAFFYAGMVRHKNAVSTIYQSFLPLGVIGILWAVIGYSFAFSDGNSFMGDTSYAMLDGVGQAPTEGATIPHQVFMIFQMMFAIITPALMTGAFAERIRFKAWSAILIIWSLVVYSPVAHWVWGPNGWIGSMGGLDFAGGIVVHITAGYSALIAALMLGKGKDFHDETKQPYNTALVAIGTTLLFFGWFGFNAGSALTSGALAAQAFVNTFMAAAVALVTWTVIDVVKDGKPTLVGACIGIVAGLVAVTPAAGFVTAISSMWIGLAAGLVCNLMARLVKHKFKIDDTLDVFACHGIGGTVGVIMTGLLATTEINPDGADGLLNGGEELLKANITGFVAVALYSIVATFFIIKIVGAFTKVRATVAEETAGLDKTQHGETMLSK